MKTPANYRPLSPTSTPHGWLPAAMTSPRAIEVSHWRSRAARGHTWNGNGAERRRS